MKTTKNIFGFPTEEIMQILRKNNNNKIYYKRSKKAVKKYILDADINYKEKKSLFKKFRESEWFYDKIHIDIRDSSPQYFEERVSIQFYREELSFSGEFYPTELYTDRISFEVNRQNDYKWLIDCIETEIKNKKYFLDLQNLFFWILEKKDTYNKHQFIRSIRTQNQLEKELNEWKERLYEGRIKVISKKEKKDIEKQKEEVINKKTYILKDKNTGYYKIGRSSNPLDREKTLQSEKPTYELIKIFNNDIETKLHKKYKKQNVRGEWFDLSKIQLKYICTNYK